MNGSFVPSGKNPDSPFAKTEVRQAVAYALDIDSLIKNLNYGYAEPTTQWGSKKNWAYNPEVKGYPFDSAKGQTIIGSGGLS